MTSKSHRPLRVFVERLRDGHTERMEETVSSSFIGCDAEDLAFRSPVVVKGEAYLSDADLIIHLRVSTEASLPCRICNEGVVVMVVVRDLYIAEPLERVKSGVFNFSDPVREALLLEVPHFAECGGGHCVHRGEVERYLRQPDASDGEEERYHPFTALGEGGVLDVR